MQSVAAFLKLLRALVHAHVGWWTIRAKFPKLSQAEREQEVQAWAARMLAIMGIRLAVQGTPPQGGPLLVVSNHVSWLDIVIMMAAAQAGDVTVVRAPDLDNRCPVTRSNP